MAAGQAGSYMPDSADRGNIEDENITCGIRGLDFNMPAAMPNRN
jgi:hypothetical protein